jgi:hypothetical protein
MGVIRLILLIAVLGGLTLLLAQNWSPAISLVFLGMQTQPLPLAMWILFSTTAGAVTSLFITSLFKVVNYVAKPPQRPTSSRSRFTPPRTNQTRSEEPTPRPSSPPPPANKTNSSNRDTDDDDWGTNNNTDDWDFEEKSEEAPAPSPQTKQDRYEKTYEPPQQEPKSSSQSGSVYSYSYREPKNSGVGKTESVYDADYRVIIPPYQPPANNQADDNTNDSDDDDWSFFDDDDDFEDENKRPQR